MANLEGFVYEDILHLCLYSSNKKLLAAKQVLATMGYSIHFLITFWMEKTFGWIKISMKLLKIIYF